MEKPDLIYISNTRIPSKKANTYQSFCMCEAFSRFFGNTYLWYPNRHNPDNDIANVDPFDFYYIRPVFKLVSFPTLSKLPVIDKSSWFWYRITSIIFSVTIASVLLISQLFRSRRIIFVRDVGVLKSTSFLKKIKLLKTVCFNECNKIWAFYYES